MSKLNVEHSEIHIRAFLWPYFIESKFVLFVFLVTVFLATIETGLEAYFYKLVIDTVTQVEPSKLLMAILWPALFYVGMNLYHNLNMRAYAWAMVAFYPRLKKHVMNDLFHYSTQHSVSFFQSNMAGDIAAKIQDITESIEPLIRNVFEIFIARVMQPIIVALFLSLVSWEYSIVFVVWAILFVLCTLKLSKPVARASSESSKERNQLSGRVIDVLGNIITTKMFGRDQFEHENLNVILSTVQEKEEKLHWSILRLHFTQGLMSLIIVALFMALLIHHRLENSISVGDFVFVLSLLAANIVHVYALGEGIGESTKIMARFRQAVNVLMQPHDVKDKPNAKDVIIAKGSIDFKAVDFHYIEGSPIFHNFNLTIRAGEKIGIVGASGAGKSSFVNLLLRLIEPQQGLIQVDGCNISDMTLSSLRSQIALVPQQIDLFHRSVLDNIRYGNLDADEAQVKHAAQLAECEDFINQLPQGYNTLVGERGMKLSGGQKQRIAIARAYLKPAKILILDEATASLDSITEAYIQRALTKIMKDKTTLIIAHRLATLKQVDRILIFEKGQVVQDGSLEVLVNQPGPFSELWKHQYFMDSDAG